MMSLYYLQIVIKVFVINWVVDFIYTWLFFVSEQALDRGVIILQANIRKIKLTTNEGYVRRHGIPYIILPSSNLMGWIDQIFGLQPLVLTSESYKLNYIQQFQ